MRTELVTKGKYKATDKLKEIVEKKLDRLEKYFDTASAVVTLKEVGKDKFAMEVTFSFPGGFVRSEVISGNMYDNIDLILPKIERQIRKFKTKENARQKTAKPMQEAVFMMSGQPEPKLKRRKSVKLEELTIDEAIDAMLLVGHSFYTFINRANHKVAIVYCRNDDNIGFMELVY